MKGNANDAQLPLGTTIKLDGQDIKRDCFAFDTDEGWVDVYVRNADGSMPHGDTIPQKRQYGVVTVG